MVYGTILLLLYIRFSRTPKLNKKKAKPRLNSATKTHGHDDKTGSNQIKM